MRHTIYCEDGNCICRTEDAMTTQRKLGRMQDRLGELNIYACGCWIHRGSAGEQCIEWCPLHAAAPDLAAACEDALAYFDEQFPRMDFGLPAKLRAALAKAGR